ncbi:MAG: hypothetical protein DLM59_10280 [Pseudonocardiales bacterium]|nr:MAG: hypothetical protein DLM59_10280 [Pseudonocardiales bacterium]
MRTENDLRDAIRERADRAPTTCPDLVPARPTERDTRLSAGIAVATAAAAVVAVSVVPSMVRDVHEAQGAAQRSATKPATRPGGSAPVARTTPPPALLASRTWISYSDTDAVANVSTVQAQYIELRPVSDGFQVREIIAFAPGLFATSLISKPQPVTVNGATGYFGAVLPWRNDNVSHTDPAHTDPRGSKYAHPMPAVVWKIGADQWAAVISNAPGEGNATALTAIAGRVQATDAPVTTPIKIGYLPPGFMLSDVDHSPLNDQYSANSSAIGFRRNTKYDYADWTVTVTKLTSTVGPSGSPPGQAVSGYPEMHRTVGEYVITVATQGVISKAQGMQVLGSVTLARQPDSPNDTWFTLAQALP